MTLVLLLLAPLALAAGPDLPRYLDAEDLLDPVGAAAPALSACFEPGSAAQAVRVAITVGRDGRVLRVDLPGAGPVASPRDACLTSVLGALRFRPHDEPSDTWITTVAWSGDEVHPWPVATRVVPPRGPVLLRLPASGRAEILERLGLPLVPEAPAPGPPPAPAR